MPRHDVSRPVNSGLTKEQIHRLLTELEDRSEAISNRVTDTDEATDALYPEDNPDESEKIIRNWYYTRGWGRGMAWGLQHAIARLRVQLDSPEDSGG